MTAHETFPETLIGGGGELIEFRTALTAGEVSRAFRETLERTSKRVEFSRIDSHAHRLDEVEVPATYSVLCTLDWSVNGWAVQLHVFDHGDFRDIRLVILGTSGIGRMFAGAMSYSRAAGRASAALVMGSLRRLDPQLSVF